MALSSTNATKTLWEIYKHCGKRRKGWWSMIVLLYQHWSSSLSITAAPKVIFIKAQCINTLFNSLPKKKTFLPQFRGKWREPNWVEYQYIKLSIAAKVGVCDIKLLNVVFCAQTGMQTYKWTGWFQYTNKNIRFLTNNVRNKETNGQMHSRYIRLGWDSSQRSRAPKDNTITTELMRILS